MHSGCVGQSPSEKLLPPGHSVSILWQVPPLEVQGSSSNAFEKGMRQTSVANLQWYYKVFHRTCERGAAQLEESRTGGSPLSLATELVPAGPPEEEPREAGAALGGAGGAGGRRAATSSDAGTDASFYY